MRFIPFLLLLLCGSSPGQPTGEETLAREYRALRETIGRKEFSAAIDRCKDLIKRYPHHMPLYETLGEVHQYAGRLPEGIAFFGDRIIDGAGMSLAYYGLGNIYYLMQEDRSAIQHLDRAIELGLDHADCYKLLEYAYERLEGVDNTIKVFTVLSNRYPENANYWYALALAYWGKGDYASCRAYLEQAIYRCAYEVRFRQVLAALNLSTRGLPEDEEIVEMQIDEAFRSSDESAVHYLRAVLVQELVGRKDVHGAKRVCQKSLAEAAQSGEFRWIAWVSLKMADIAFFSGELDSAKFFAKEAILAGILSGTPAATRDAMERMTEAFLETSDFLGALNTIGQRLSQPHIRESERDKAKIALDLSRALLELGYPTPAIEIASAALSLAQSANGDSLLLCQIHTSIGLAFLEIGRHDEAERNLVLADRYNPFDGFHGQVASVTYGNRGLLSLDQHDLQQAHHNFGTQARLAVSSGFLREQGVAFANLANVFALERRVDLAQEHYLKGYQIGLDLRNASLIAQCAKGLARMYQRSDDPKRAVRWHLVSVDAADSMVMLGEKARAYPDYAALTALLVDSKRASEAFLVSERSKAYTHRSSVLTALAQHQAEEALGGSMLESLVGNLRFAGVHRKRQNLSDIWHFQDHHSSQGGTLPALQDDLVEVRGPLNASLRYSLGPESSECFRKHIQSLIPDSTLLVEFARAGDKWVMFVLTNDTLEIVETSLNSSQMEKLVDRCSRIFISELADQQVWNAALAQFDRGALFELYSSTILLARKDKHEFRRLIIVPDGPLRKIPFESLVCDFERGTTSADFSRGRFLLEECTIRYLPTATTLASKTRKSPAEKLLLAVGGISPQVTRSITDPLTERALKGASAGGRTALPGSSSEIKGLRRIVQLSATVLSEEEATKAKLLEEGPHHRIVHIAAHVRRDVRRPWRSGFVVSSGKESGSKDITVFDLIEISERADLVVLSGCSSDSPAKDAAPGGFGTALLASGVPSVVSTLWDIDDATSSEIMIAFYANLFDGIQTDEALRQAKLEIVRSGRTDPYYWAGFVLNGTASNLDPRLEGAEPRVAFSIEGVVVGVGVLLGLTFLARSSPRSSPLRLSLRNRGAV